MNKNWTTIFLAAFFIIIGFLILLDQRLSAGIWFQAKDLHHETFALTAFAFAIGMLVGSIYTRK